MEQSLACVFRAVEQHLDAGFNHRPNARVGQSLAEQARRKRLQLDIPVNRARRSLIDRNACAFRGDVGPFRRGETKN